MESWSGRTIPQIIWYHESWGRMESEYIDEGIFIIILGTEIKSQIDLYKETAISGALYLMKFHVMSLVSKASHSR